MKTKYLKIVIAVLFQMAISHACQAKDFSLTSYYPAPYGVYKTLTLTPSNPSGNCIIGSMTVSPSGNNDIYVCQVDGNGNNVWGPLPGSWKQTTNNLYPADTSTDSNISLGIGTENPDLKLSIVGDGGILSTGTFGSGETLQTTGAGTRLIWYPKKSAYRAGSVDDDRWDEAKIGNYSTILGGFNNFAPGSFSVVIGGDTNQALGQYSTVGGGDANQAAVDYSAVGGGLGNKARGAVSVIGGGDNSTASGDHSAICGGHTNQATGAFSAICGGKNIVASGDYSTVCGGSIGFMTSLNSYIPQEAKGNYSAIAGGYGNYATGNESFIGGGVFNYAIGNQSSVCGGGGTNYDDVTGGNHAAGANSAIGGGHHNYANAKHSSIVGGDNNTTNGYASSILGGANLRVDGEFSMAMGSQLTLTDTADRTFVWGNSLNAVSVTTPDVFIVNSGNVGIGTINPVEKLHVKDGNIKVTGTALYLSNPPVTLPGASLPLPLKLHTGTKVVGLDLAEQFETSEEVETGDVLVVDPGSQIKLKKSTSAHSQGIIGIASGSPGIIFNSGKLQMSPPVDSFIKGNKVPVALAGRVPCKVTNENGPIEVGDLLTTSSVPGYAMKSDSNGSHRGTIIGKAMESFTSGPNKENKGMIIVFVTRQ